MRWPTLGSVCDLSGDNAGSEDNFNYLTILVEMENGLATKLGRQ